MDIARNEFYNGIFFVNIARGQPLNALKTIPTVIDASWLMDRYMEEMIRT